MKLTLVKSHKSITSLPNIELSDFVVLTGVNGAGKTHLLEAIENGSVQIDNIVVDNQTKPIRLFNWSNLVPNDSGAFAPYQITQEIYGLWSEIFQNIKRYHTEVADALRQLGMSALLNANIRRVISMTEADLIAIGCSLEQANQVLQTIQNITNNVNQNITNNFVRGDINRQRFIDLLKENTKIPLLTFEENDFYENYPQNWQPIDMFQQSLGRLFAEYQKNWLANEMQEFRSWKGKPVKFLSKKEFLEQYGEPPWDFLNSVLEAANLDFCINKPAEDEDRPYEPILTERIRGTQVKFADLSSGERILMSFALCLYYAKDQRQLVNYPKVLLFDEIDAPLHPSMTQSLLNTIQEALINRHQIKVILTTHSPSTVALAPEESVYVMQKLEQRRLEKTTKDKALALLTAGVPTLSIDYENRRQVFVESDYDVKNYEQIYKKLKDQLILEISINFIPAGVGGKGNCDQVREVVNQLYKCGNKTAYGIIDWDLKNNENERVKVLGYGNRYSIENYILDPVLVVAFLLREKIIERSAVYCSSPKFRVLLLQEYYFVLIQYK
jgi:ABC-type multidrug transport system ATPase subunit